MLIYAMTFTAAPTATVEQLSTTVSDWLSRKAGQHIDADILLKPYNIATADNIQIQSWAANGRDSRMAAVRLSHRDKNINGRRWDTEIGLSQQTIDTPIRASVRLRTRDVSTRVANIPSVTRPIIAHMLVQQHGDPERCPGITLKQLTADNITDVARTVWSVDRRHPVILVSTDPDGNYLLDPERLRFLVAGLADVYEIPATENSYFLADHLTKQYTAWHGAVNIIYPIPHGRVYPHNYLLLSERIHDIAAQGPVEDEVLSLLCHITNLPNSWKHIAPEQVAAEVARQRLVEARQRAAQSGETADYVALLEETNAEVEEANRQLQQEIDELRIDSDLQLLEAQDKCADYERTISALQTALASAGITRDAPTQRDDIAPILQSLIIDGEPSLTESLDLVRLTFPDRVVVLDTAYRSAGDSTIFRHRKRALALLWQLCTDYWSALAEGKGDTVARQCFGTNAFSANESQTVENTAAAVKRRTFTYKGQSITMFKHLKIGVKDSAAETLRIHFEWLPDERKIVIGHCGPHLNFK